MKLGIIYKISQYIGLLKLLLGFPEAYLLVRGKRIYFNNFDAVGIFNNTYHESLSKKEIYDECDCYIDVGAHMGFKSFWFHESNPTAGVMVFEPNPLSFSLLERNLKHIKDLRKAAVALGAEDGEMTIHVDPGHMDTASLNPDSFYLKNNARGKIDDIKVKVEKLDNYVDGFRSKKSIYLKIDVETFEKEVLRGGMEFLNLVKYLEIEIFQDQERNFSETLALVNRKFNLVECAFLKSPNSAYPKVVTVLLSF